MDKKIESSRHHYIPVWYQKYFTSGQFYVYRKSRKVILPRLRPPKSVFFEYDRNTSAGPEGKTDLIESSLYMAVDNECSDIFSTIMKKALGSIDSADTYELIQIMNLMRTRNPKFDTVVNTIFQKYDFSDLRFDIYNKQTGQAIPKEERVKFTSDDLFTKSQAVTLQLLPFLKNPQEMMKVASSTNVVEWKIDRSLLSDNPCILYENKYSIDSIGEFIFPLSKTRCLIYHKKPRPFTAYDLLLKDLLLIDQATEYVVCEDKSHLSKTLLVYEEIQKRGIDLMEMLFKEEIIGST